MIIGSDILIITLNVNGLNAPTKRQTGWEDENMCMYALPLPHHSAWPPPPNCMWFFYIVVNHVLIMACICNYLLYFCLAIDCENW